MPLVDGQWRLVYPGTDFTFGAGTTWFLTSPPDMGAPDPDVQDAAQPGADGTVFGRDTRQGATLTMEMGVDAYGEVQGMDALGTLHRVWRGDTIRSTPGAVAALYHHAAGRERVTYGRPRRFASTIQQDPKQGYSSATVDFQRVDDLWYDSVATSVTLSLVPPRTGGFRFPLRFPVSMTPPTTRPGQTSIGGTVDTWPVVTFTGPVTAPRLDVGAYWHFTLNTSLAPGQTAVIDTRPWARTVLRSDGGNLAGALTRRSRRLSDARLPAGETVQLTFTGTDHTGTATCTLAYRSAWPHI